MWMRRGTPGHVAAPRGPTRRLRGVYIYLYYAYSTFFIKWGFSLPYMGLHDLFENGPSWTIYRNRWSFWSDGYAQKHYKMRCISTILSIRVEISIQLNCLDTLSLVSLDSIVFLFHFCTHGAFVVEIWWIIEWEIAAWSSSRRSWCSSWLIGLIAVIWSQNGISGSGFSWFLFL